MEHRTLGRSGLKISGLALGTDNIANPTSASEAKRIITRAIDAGINLIDTADSYSAGESERVIGKSLKGGLRERVLISTKGHYPTGRGPNESGNSRHHLIAACEASLKRLGCGHIDLYLLHRPSPDIHIEETLGALTDLVRAGKVRYIGTSTHPAWQAMEAVLVAEFKGYTRIVCDQPPYNLLDRRIENELVPLARRYDLGLITWSPLAMGMLAGRYQRADAPPEQSRASLRGGIYAERVAPLAVETGNRFAALARDHGLDPAQAAAAWTRHQQGVTAPIIGPKSLDQLETMLPSMELRLSNEFLQACDDLVPPGSAVANFHNSAPWMKMRIG